MLRNLMSLFIKAISLFDPIIIIFAILYPNITSEPGGRGGS